MRFVSRFLHFELEISKLVTSAMENVDINFRLFTFSFAGLEPVRNRRSVKTLKIVHKDRRITTVFNKYFEEDFFIVARLLIV